MPKALQHTYPRWELTRRPTMPNALQHTYPRWKFPERGEPDEFDDGREVWHGHMHIVSPKRARKLRKRGVPLMPLHKVRTVQVHNKPERHEPTTPNGRARYAWFEPTKDYETRQHRRGNPQLDLYARAWRTMAPNIVALWASVPTILRREDALTRVGNLLATRMLSEATPEQLDAAAKVDMSDFRSLLP